MTDTETTVPHDISEKLTIDNVEISENTNLQLDTDSQTDIKNTIENNTHIADNINCDNNENEQNVQNKRANLIDSDSENETQSVSSEKSKLNNLEQILNSDSESVTQFNIKTNKKRLTLIDSDSEDEENVESKSQDEENDTKNASHPANKSNKKRLTLLDSDSENDLKENTVQTNEDEDIFSKEEQGQKKKSRLLQLCDSDSEDETKTDDPSPKISEEEEIQHETLQRLKTLCDSESSAEETEDKDEDISSKNIIKQKRQRKKAEPKEKKMTGKEAQEQRREIISESQKMIRESRVYLPYHLPKQHTLQEFLKRRSLVKGTTKAPPNTPTGLSIKMCSKNIKTIQMKLKQKEKEIEEFYKCESEAEDEQEIETSKQESSQKNNQNIENELQKNTESKPEEQTENTDKMEVDSNETEETTSENLLQGNIDEEINCDLPQTEENNQEESCVGKSSEELQQNIIEDQETVVEETQIVKSYEERNEEMKIDEDISQLQNTTENNQNVSNIQEIEQETLDSKQITEENSSEDREEKLKELRDILEKNLTHSEAQVENEMETEQPELENVILDPELEQSQNSSQEALKILAEKEEKKKKLAAIEEKLKKLNPLVAITGNLHPKLSGGPNELIILDENIEKTKQVTNFMQRFLNHAVKKSEKKQDSILNTTKVPVEDLCDEPAKKIQIPGVRMKKLRLELTGQINKQRLLELKKRQEEEKLDNEDETYVGEKETCQLSNKVLDNEEEDELTDPSSSSEEEEEEEEDDIEIKEKPRIKSTFFDDEAEESDDVEDDSEEMENEDDSEIDQNEETNLEPPTKKPLRRILKPTKDSDEETNSRPKSQNEEKNKNDNWEDNDDDIPAYQQPSDGLEKTPCKFATQKKDITNFLTPTLHLTALQGMGSATKSLQGSPNVNSFLPPEPSPLKLNTLVKTKLFSDQEDANLDELENLCSGKFPTQIENKSEKRNNDLSTQENELLDICSGRFTGFTQNESSTRLESSIPMPKPTQSLDLLMNEDSQNFILTIENDTTDYIRNTNPEPEQSKPENLKPQETISIPKYQKMKICSSSEDEDKENTSPKKKKLQKKKRKYIIDDISITDEDDFEDLDDLDEDIEEPRNVEYDSEENEIEIDEEHEVEETEKPANKASDFFENEAELSESDWGSEDEDEKNLDDYEIEEGDGEKINEKKVQRELERMHMRNILDDDQREVKLLQELLLEDGELHGTGRERKFRWKNADLLWNNDSDKPKEEEEEQEEIECELQWRKMRHEREMFLKEHQSKRPPGEDEILNDNQLMKLGQKALKKSLSGSQSQNLSQKKTPIAESVATTDDIKLPFALAIKRGSFLQRSETTLQRLAEITKISGNIGGAKNSKNFIFTSVEKTESEEEVNVKKRKAEEDTPKILKKLRIADMSPNVQKRKKKLPL